MLFAEIILPLNLKGTFTYKVPEELLGKLSVGMRVLVPFRGRKIYTGIVSSIHENPPEKFVPRDVISTLDESPVLPEEQIQFWHWLSEYYLCNLGEIYRFAVPASLKLESETYLKLRPNASVDFQNLDANEMHLIQALEVQQILNLSSIEAFIPKKDIIKTINSLIDLQYIEIDEKIHESYKVKEVSYVRLKNPEEIEIQLSEILQSLNRAKKQKDLFLTIFSEQKENPEKPIRKSELLENGGFSSNVLKALIEKGWVEEYFLQQDRLSSYEGEIEELEELSELQTEAKNKIDTYFEEGKNVLLHGVTSSGKTHVYLEKIHDELEAGKKVLILVPEISLAKQMTQRLEKKYGKILGFYHQKLTDFERVEVWKKLKNEELKIIIGTRNALFLPIKNLGLIVIDEEHDYAYRPKEVSPYFNAKDAAQILSSFCGAKVILSSATPSLETYYAAQNGKLGYIFLGERFGGVSTPSYELIDFKKDLETMRVKGNFSMELLEEIQQNLDQENQIMILHNRRGYANVVECESCGNVVYCSNCDVVMTYHKSTNDLKCHYCGQKSSKPQFCSKCHSQNLNERGVGVEQIHEEISSQFPTYEVDRMDVDAMRRKFAYEKLYEKIENRETNIIVGTQMISKGLDFDHIELVAIPKADHLLYIPDFRAEERAFQLITQLSGRAGRVSGKGKLVIQTYHPQHSIFKLIQEKNEEKIYEYFLDERKKYHYPPFTKIILLELKHRKEDKADRSSQFLGSVLRKYLPQECVFGPEKSSIPRLKTLYQYQILLKLPRGKNYNNYKDLVVKSLEEFREIVAYQSIKLEVFVDF